MKNLIAGTLRHWFAPGISAACYGVANDGGDTQSLDWKTCFQAGRRRAGRRAESLAVVLIPSDILGWPVYPTIYITLDIQCDLTQALSSCTSK